MLEWETSTTSKGRKVKFRFEESAAKTKNEQKDLEDIFKRMFLEGYDYVSDIIGDDKSVLPEWVVVRFENSKKLRAHGIIISVGMPLLKEYQSSTDNYEKDITFSRVIHEIVHGITTGEDLPMLAEMVYVLDKGHTKRISQIGQLLSKGGLPKPHVQGLENIKNWLGYDSSEEMLEDIPNKDIGDLKKKFAEYSKKEVETGG